MDNCALQTKIEATSEDGSNVRLIITSDCQSIQKLSQELKEVSIFQMMGKSILDSIVYQKADGCLRHAACLVPAAIIRTVEVETNIALQGAASFSVEKVQS